MKAAELIEHLGAKKKKSVSDIARVVKTRTSSTGNFSLLLGAGASKSSGIRTAGELIEEWRSAAFSDEFSGDGIDSYRDPNDIKTWLTENAKSWYNPNREYSSLISKIYPVPRSRRQMIEHEVSGKLPSIGYAYVVRLAENRYLTSIFTTNFDDLIPEAFYQFSNERPLVCAHDSSVHSLTLTSDRAKIIKLHGDYLFDDIKNTSSETTRLEENMRSKFREFLKEFGLIVCGYSGSDRSLMSILSELIQEEHYLQNGLYWTFRPEDEVNDEVLAVLENSNAFYTIVDGFDELFADLHNQLITTETPFSSRLAVRRADRLIQHYLENKQFQGSKSIVIQNHMAEIKADRNSTLVSDALRELSSDSGTKDKLNDSDLLTYLEVEKLIRSRKPDLALKKIEDDLNECQEISLKKILLRRAFVCAKRLNRRHDALSIAKKCQEIDPDNYFIDLNKIDLIDNRKERIMILRDIEAKAPYNEDVITQLGIEMSRQIGSEEADPSTCCDDVITTFRKSLKINPSIENDGWRQLFNFVSENEQNIADADSILCEILDSHLEQAGHAAGSLSILFEYCKLRGVNNYNGVSLFDRAREAFSRHYPHDYVSHIDVIKEICYEFEDFSLLRHALAISEKDPEIVRDDSFVALKMDILYDFCRDLPAAIELGKSFVNRTRSVAVEMRLFKFLLANGDCTAAREQLTALSGALLPKKTIELEAELLEAEGRYQDAIDKIHSVPDRLDFYENHIGNISFLYLRAGLYDKARELCAKFLSGKSRNFSPRNRACTINYEFARLKTGSKVKVSRVRGVIDRSTDPDFKGAGLMLLNDYTAAEAIFKRECEKKFSNIDRYLRWPILGGIKDRLINHRNVLVGAKRSLD